jgi:hypothetical protein
LSEKTLQTMFWIGTIAIFPFWILVIFFPRQPITRRMVESLWPYLLPAAAHTAFIGMLLRTRPDLQDDYAALFPLSAGKVIDKLTERDMATVGWLHMLLGDVFIGRWIYLDSRERNMNPWLASLPLAVTSTSGSIGLPLYLLLRVLTPDA